MIRRALGLGALELAALALEPLLRGALWLGALVLAPLRLEPLLRGALELAALALEPLMRGALGQEPLLRGVLELAALRQCTFERDASGRRSVLELTSLGRLGSQVKGIRPVLTEGRGTVVLEEPLGRFEMLAAGTVESLGLFHEGKEPVL